MKRSRILWGVAMIAVAVLLILNACGVTLGLPESIPLWRILLGALCLVWVVNELIKLRIPGIFFPLIFIVMLFEKEIAGLLNIADGDIASTWVFLLIALLLTIGSGLLFPKHLRIQKCCSDKNCEASNDKGFSVSWSNNRVNYIDCSRDFCQEIENNLGACEVFFTNTVMYEGNGKINVENNLGSVTINVPDSWNVVSTVENSLGSVDIPNSKGNKDGKQLIITGENNLGKLHVRFIKDDEAN